MCPSIQTIRLHYSYSCLEDSACSIREIKKNNELIAVKLFVLVQCNPSFFIYLFLLLNVFFTADWFDKQPLMQRLRRGRQAMKR